jgi:hypothetical protein
MQVLETVKDGDCLFDAIRLVLESIGISQSASDLRNLVVQTILHQGIPVSDERFTSESVLRLFEQQLQVRFLILEGNNLTNYNLHRPLVHQEKEYSPTHYICLQLFEEYYQPLAWDGLLCFLPTELPRVISDLMRPPRKR